MSSFLPVDPHRFAAVSSSLLTRGVLYALGAVPMALFAILWTVLTIIGIADAKDGMTWLAGALVLLLGGVIPTILTVLLAWRALANLGERSRLGVLQAAVSSGVVRSMDDLARAMNSSPAKTETTLRDAMGRGLFASQSIFMPAPAHSHAAMRPTMPASSPTSSGASWIGRTIRGAYLIESALGRGGMGVVFRARHLASGTPCAFKILLANRYDAPDVFRRFEREATLSRSLAHPGLVRVDDFGIGEDGTPYLVMELLDGETLEQRLGRLGVLAWPDALRVVFAVGDALAAAHRTGFLHRDLKPSNIMLARGPRGERPVLVDFGLAKKLEASARSRITRTGAVVGTPLYLSPEQARGESLDERSDLYGLAVVLYEMIAGVPPFFDATLAAVYARLLHEAPPRLSGVVATPVPPLLDAALARAMAPRREDRFASVGEFLSALARVA